jgi:hypothetical protein
MKISVKSKEVYGRMLYYPSCIKSKLLAKVKGDKKITLTDRDLEIIKLLGYEIVFV